MTKQVDDKKQSDSARVQRFVGQPSPKDMALNYYQSGIRKHRPDYVPDEVFIPYTVRADSFPGMTDNTHVRPGKYKCKSNQWGAISVQATNGKMLGIKQDEFEPLTWRPNE